MSLTPPPPSPRKVRLWRIFFALPVKNGPLPAELKFRENTATPHSVCWLSVTQLPSCLIHVMQ